MLQDRVPPQARACTVTPGRAHHTAGIASFGTQPSAWAITTKSCCSSTQFDQLLALGRKGTWGHGKLFPYVLHNPVPPEVAEAVGQWGGRTEPGCGLLHPLHRHFPNTYGKTTLAVLAKNILRWEKTGPVNDKSLVFLSSPGR